MKFTVGSFNPDTGMVPVTFKHDGVTHKRDVMAVKVEGVYDAKATREQVQAVANGVEHKIAIGVIS